MVCGYALRINSHTHTHMHRLVLEDLTWVEKEDLRSKSNKKALDVV